MMIHEANPFEPPLAVNSFHNNSGSRRNRSTILSRWFLLCWCGTALGGAVFGVLASISALDPRAAAEGVMLCFFAGSILGFFTTTVGLPLLVLVDPNCRDRRVQTIVAACCGGLCSLAPAAVLFLEKPLLIALAAVCGIAGACFPVGLVSDRSRPFVFGDGGFRDLSNKLADDVVGVHAFGLSLEVGGDTMSQHRDGDAADVGETDCGAAGHGGHGFGAGD
jgi:hypothetical protein